MYKSKTWRTEYFESVFCSHLSNGLVERALDELVAPVRKLKLKQEEIVCLEAIVALNPRKFNIQLFARNCHDCKVCTYTYSYCLRFIVFALQYFCV